jgi:thiamine pyrophosphokinase
VSAAHRAALVFAAAPLRSTARIRARLAGLNLPYVVAADEGAATALAFGFQPDVVVGDLDSINSATLAELRRRGVPIRTYPRDKNDTDGQLAIEHAVQLRPSVVWLLGFLGGPRLDQMLANVFFLTQLQTPAVLLDERNECTLMLPGTEHTWRTEPGEIVSLLPLDGDVEGVRTAGLRWQLDNERLVLGQTRGVSNEPIGPEAHVSTEHGLLLVTRHFPN